MKDRVASAARSLRDLHDGASLQHASTRRRILAEAALRSRRRRRLFATVWLPLAAVLVVSSAWAAVTGNVLCLVTLLRGTPHETLKVANGTETAAHRVGEGETAVTAIPSAIPSATPDLPTTDISMTSTTASRARASSQSPAPARPAVEEALYSAAHRAHFVEHDPAAALRAWDDYLAAYPAGRFGLEARYNRALALVRLGRTNEARTALVPFADGRSGAYRQAEARSLLDTLAADP